MSDFKAVRNKSSSQVSKFISANYKSHLRNLTAVSLRQTQLHTYMREFALGMNRIKVSLKVLRIPTRTEIEIVHVSFSGSQMGDLITIIGKLIQPI